MGEVRLLNETTSDILYLDDIVSACDIDVMPSNPVQYKHVVQYSRQLDVLSVTRLPFCPNYSKLRDSLGINYYVRQPDAHNVGELQGLLLFEFKFFNESDYKRDYWRNVCAQIGLSYADSVAIRRRYYPND